MSNKKNNGRKDDKITLDEVRERFDKMGKKDSDIKKSISLSLGQFTLNTDKVKYYKDRRQLLVETLITNDNVWGEMLSAFNKNLKHIKGNYRKDLKEYIKQITDALKGYVERENIKSFWDKAKSKLNPFG